MATTGEKKNVVYKRSRFSTRLPADLRYTASHSWVARDGDGRWRVGFTKFATRVLGDPVEFDVELKPEAPVEVGQVIGWLEGFKAVTDLFCPMAGRFLEINAELAENLDLLRADPYGRGWLYLLDATPGDDCVDVAGYVEILDAAIDKMTGKQTGSRK